MKEKYRKKLEMEKKILVKTQELREYPHKKRTGNVKQSVSKKSAKEK